MTSHLLHLPSSNPACSTATISWQVILVLAPPTPIPSFHIENKWKSLITLFPLYLRWTLNPYMIWPSPLSPTSLPACFPLLTLVWTHWLLSVAQTQPASSCFRAFGLAVHSALNNQSLVCLLIIQAPEFKYHLLGEAFPDDLSKVATASLSRCSKITCFISFILPLMIWSYPVYLSTICLLMLECQPHAGRDFVLFTAIFPGLSTACGIRKTSKCVWGKWWLNLERMRTVWRLRNGQSMVLEEVGTKRINPG